MGRMAVLFLLQDIYVMENICATFQVSPMHIHFRPSIFVQYSKLSHIYYIW